MRITIESEHTRAINREYDQVAEADPARGDELLDDERRQLMLCDECAKNRRQALVNFNDDWDVCENCLRDALVAIWSTRL